MSTTPPLITDAPISLPVPWSSADSLHQAIRDNLPLEKLLPLMTSASVNKEEENGEYPLYIAVRTGNLPLIDALLEKGADPTITVSHCNLFQYIMDRDLKTLQHLLIRLKGHPGLPDMINWSLIVGKKSEFIVALLEACAEIDYTKIQVRETPMHICAWGNVQGLEFLLSKNPSLLDFPEHTGKTPLHVACHCSAEAALFLIQAGAKINTADKGRTTPLHTACCMRKKEVVIALLDRGAQHDVKDNLGSTPFLLACELLDAETLEKFRMKGASLDQTYINGRNGIDEALRCNNLSTLRYLLDNNVPILKGKKTTPFHDSLRRQDLVELFLKWQKDRLAKVMECLSKEVTEENIDLALRTVSEQEWMHDAYAASPYSEEFSIHTMGIYPILSSDSLLRSIGRFKEILSEKVSQANSIEELEKLKEKLKSILDCLSDIRKLYPKLFQQPFLATFCNRMASLIESYDQLLHTCISKQTSLTPEDPEAEFDESDVFGLLATLGIGVGQTNDGNPVSPLESFVNLIGVEPPELYELGILTGADLRVLGITFTLRFLCSRIRNSGNELCGQWCNIQERLENLIPYLSNRDELNTLLEMSKKLVDHPLSAESILDFHRKYSLFLLKTACLILKENSWQQIMKDRKLESLSANREEFMNSFTKGIKRKQPENINPTRKKETRCASEPL